MKVPLLDVNAQNLPLEGELVAAFTRVLRSGTFILGPEVEAFERQIAEVLGVRNAIGVSSGTDAILLGLMALGIGVGDEVLIPTFTFFATAGCVSRAGATPVFVDSCPTCFNIDVTDARQKVTARTKAIVPVHLFGQSADMDGVMALAREHGLHVIEDAAQALGAAYKGRFCGSIGDFGTYSFFPSKNLGGFGDGGMLVTDNDDLAEKARIMRVHGSRPKYFHKYVGGNFRLDSVHAALLRVKAQHNAKFTEARRANAVYYEQRLRHVAGIGLRPDMNGGCGSCEALSETSEVRIQLPATHPPNHHIWNQFTIQVLGRGNRDALKKDLADKGIGSEIYYPLTMDQQECFADLSIRGQKTCPVAHRLSKEVLGLPIYPELSDQMKDAVIDGIISFLASRAYTPA
ncbi:MAG: DegT/DnrJ/EryC1/StrS family aminotransferase [Verrucomicrobiales bacterium]